MAKKIHYSDSFQPRFGMPYVAPPTPEVIAQMSEERLRGYLERKQMFEVEGAKNPVGWGWTMPSWEMVMDCWKKYNVIVLLGGNQCVRADTMIYDPILGFDRRIDSIRGKHHVYAWNGKEVVVAEAEEPFSKPAGEMLRISLSTGSSFVAALEHRVLGADGRWLFVSELRPGSRLCLPASIPGTCLSDQTPSALRSSETASGSPARCSTYSRRCGEPPHSQSGSDPASSPSAGDAPKRISVLGSRLRWPSQRVARSEQCTKDGQGTQLLCSHASRAHGLLSTWDGLLRRAARFFGTRSRSSCKPCKSASRLCEDQAACGDGQQSPAGCHRSQSIHESVQRGNQSHYEVTYVTDIASEGINVKWDLTVTAHGNYVAAGVIHHNSAKTTLGARMSVWAACEIPEAEVYNFHISEKRSIDDQQRFIYENLPEWLKNMPTKKGISHSLQYTQKNGFTDGIAIVPPVKGYRRGGSIKFYNYAQYQANDQIIEGIKAHFVWADEQVPVNLFETIRMGRLGTYHGRMLITYTVVDGWNPVIEKILSRTKTLQTKFCDHPKIMANVPILQESLSVGSCCIIYAHTADNPFADFKEFMKLYGNESREVILARAYGVPTKSTTSAFPLFSKEYASDGGNVVKHEDLPWLKLRKSAKGADVPYPVTFYMALDPAGSKAWFMVWVAIDAAGTWWVYRESPENEEWALPGNKPGPATTPRIHGIKAYAEFITTAESGPEKDANIYERIIDPRMGAAERQSQDGATTIISELDDAGLTFIPAPAAASEANKGEIEDGIQLINNLLAYKADKPIDALNRPRLYVSDRCQNLIYALQEYTGKLGATEATKDCVDTVRYLCKANCQFVAYTKDDLNRTGVY